MKCGPIVLTFAETLHFISAAVKHVTQCRTEPSKQTILVFPFTSDQYSLGIGLDGHRHGRYSISVSTEPTEVTPLSVLSTEDIQRCLGKVWLQLVRGHLPPSLPVSGGRAVFVTSLGLLASNHHWAGLGWAGWAGLGWEGVNIGGGENTGDQRLPCTAALLQHCSTTAQSGPHLRSQTPHHLHL